MEKKVTQPVFALHTTLSVTIWTDLFVHFCSCNFALKDEKTFLIISVAC